MADASIAVEMAINAAKAVIGADAAVKAEERIEKGAAKIAREAKEAERALHNFARRTTEINATPMERYSIAVARAQQALSKGLISQETYNRELNRQRMLLNSAGAAQNEAFGPKALSQLQSFIAGYLSLQAAISLVTGSMAHARQENAAALGSLKGLDDPRKKLVQMAETPAELQGMLDRADKAAMAAGVPRATAYETLFQAKTFGFEKDFEGILKANEVIGAQAGAILGGKVPQMLGGQITPMESINMALAAGKPSDVDAESIANSLAITAEGSRRIGATPDEVFSTVSALSAAFKSPQVAADRLKAISHRMAQHKFGDVGIMGGFRKLKAMNATDRSKVLGIDQETNAAYEALEEFEPKIMQIEAAVRTARLATGTEASPLAVKMRIAESTTQTKASLKSRQAEIGKEIAREGALAAEQAERQFNVEGVQANAYNRGLKGQFLSSVFAGAAEGLGFGPKASGAAAQAGIIAQNPAKSGASVGVEWGACIAEILSEIRDQGRNTRNTQVLDAIAPAL